MHPLENYLSEIATLHGATKETSGYPALANLLNAVGHTLKPKVKCIIHPKNQGAGIPDGGLFTPDQLKQHDEDEIFGELIPARGVIEVKSVGEDIAEFVDSEQVEKYLAHYGQVLLTNYREFLLLKRIGGKTHRLEGFQLAPDEKSFWLATAHPRKAATDLGERFLEYLKRVMLHNAPLNNPKDVAFFLASYARDARVRVEGAANLPALQSVRAALEEALGMKFEAEKGEHFFRSTLVQTLFYGVFSAWVLWHKQQAGGASVPASRTPQDQAAREDARPTKQFDWRSAAWTLHVPMIKALFYQVADPEKLGKLKLVEVLDWTAAALNRVERNEFFAKFAETHAVQYFYEPFLEAFDPELRKQLGVWYTPPEIVQYQVARVDAALREELDIPDGLADPRVFVLDPCCGTGAYLVEVLRVIAQTLKDEKGEGALAELTIKQAAQERIFGFELLPAPFVVAHLQMGLLLQNLSVPLDDSKNERAAIYLTNALTGWEPPSEEAKKQLTFAIPEFKQEKEAADGIKQEKKIIVILGNPPYNGYAGLAVEEERDLSNAYRTTKRAAAPQGQGLNDLYIRFFRMAERRIVEKSGEGIISFISNYSWLDGLSFTGMRERYLEVFDSITVDCLNGDKFKTGKLTPEGNPDPSVFSTETNREGIQVGTAIATLIKRGMDKAVRASRQGEAALPHPNPLPLGEGTATKARSKTKRIGSDPALETILPLPAGEGRGEGERVIQFRHLWGRDKRGELLATLNEPPKKIYSRLKPPLALGLPFLPMKTESGFYKWPLLTELFPVSFPGIQTGRDDFLVSIEKDVLINRLEKYFDSETSHEEMKRIAPSVMEDSARFKAELVREELRKRGLLRKNVVRYHYRPFDDRWLYWEPETKLLDEKRMDYFLQVFDGNTWFAAVQQNRKDFDPPVAIVGYGCRHIVERGANLFPLFLRENVDVSVSALRETPDLFSPRGEGGGGKSKTTIKPNLSDAAAAYSAGLRVTPDTLFYHTLAVLHSPEYRAENSGALRQDWPRVPLPKSREALQVSAELGRQVAALLDTETPLTGVANGNVRPELRTIAVLSSTKNLSLTAGWGHAGQNGVTMPGKGKLATRPFTTEEAAAWAGGASVPASRTPSDQAAREDARPTGTVLLGSATHDVFLNESACWQNVPEKVWDYTIGGYQVIKKWLSYREFELLGRALTPDEAREVTHMARRIAALILLQPELDKNYQAVKAATVAL